MRHLQIQFSTEKGTLRYRFVTVNIADVVCLGLSWSTIRVKYTNIQPNLFVLILMLLTQSGLSRESRSALQSNSH